MKYLVFDVAILCQCLHAYLSITCRDGTRLKSFGRSSLYNFRKFMGVMSPDLYVAHLTIFGRFIIFYCN